MRILLVNPPRFNGIPVIREERCEITERYSVLPPYSLLQIGGLLKNHEVTLIDANGFNLSYTEIEEKLKIFDYDVLIFRFTPTTFDYDMKLVEISKKVNKKAKTIGICFTLRTLSKEVLKESKLDIYVLSEYEKVIPNLIKNLDKFENIKGIAYQKGKQIIVNEYEKPIENYDILPNWDLPTSLDPYFINTNDGKKTVIIYTSKGCPYQCSYCTVAGTPLKMRSADSVLKELRYLKNKFGLQKVSFFDETFTIDRERTIELCHGLRELGIGWYCNTRSNLVDFELLKIMKECGCGGLSLGIESGSQKILDNVCKGIKVEDNEKAIRLAKKAGLLVYCSFIFGLPGESKKTINETINFVKRTLPTSCQFNVAVPYPGTKLYDLAIKNKWITKFDWRSLYQHESLMNIDGLNHNDLDNARKLAYRTLYFNPKWLFQNVIFVLKNLSEFHLASKYFVKIMNNYLRYGMKHAH